MTTNALTAAFLLVSTIGACDVGEGRAQDEADRQNLEPLSIVSKGILGEVGKGLARLFFPELLNKETIVTLSEKTLHDIAELTNEAVIDNWHHDKEIELETLADDLLKYFRPECHGVGTNNDCSESNLTSKYVAADRLASAGQKLWNAYDSDAPNYAAHRLLFGQNLQLAASISLFMLSEVTILNGEDYRDLAQEYPVNQKNLCSFAGEYYVTMQDLEQRVVDRVDPLFGLVGIVDGPGSKPGHKFKRACFDSPDGLQCGDLVREVRHWWENGEQFTEASGAPAAALWAEGEALRDEAVAEVFEDEKDELLGGEFDANKVDFARIASCVDVPGPLDDFCSVFDGEEVHIRTAHGTHVSVDGIEANETVHQSKELRATEAFFVECSGNEVMFTDDDGSYLTASNGNITWAPTSSATAKFVPLAEAEGTWAFETAVGTYMRARASGEMETQTGVLGSERFHVVMASGRESVSYNFCEDYGKQTVALETTHGRYLRAGDKREVNQQSHIGPWEEIYVYCEAGNTVYFRTDHGRYIRARDTGEVDQADKVGPWERFTPVPVEGGWAFETAHGRYLRAESQQGSWDINNKGLEVEDKETFTVIVRD